MSKTNYLTAAALVACSLARAQQDSTSTKLLDAVVVTANKFEQRQHTTGKVITVIPRQTVERYHARGVAQLLNDQAGITVNGAYNSPGTRPSLFTRGAGDGRTLILLDGMPLYDPSTITNEFDINLLSLANVERIEVCKGAQSTLYGSDAVAGVINIITQKNSPQKKMGLRSTVSAGSFNTTNAQLAAYGNSGRLDYSVSASRIKTKGFSAATDTSASAFDKDGFRSTAIATHIKYKFTDALAAQFFFQRSANRTALDAASFVDERDYDYNSHTTNTGVSISYAKKSMSLVARYQFTRNKRFYLNDSSHVPQSTIFSTLDYISRANFAELISNWQLSSNIRIISGVDFRSAAMNSNGYTLSSFGPFESVFDDTIHQQYSAYANVVIKSSGGKFNLDLGGRLNVHSEYGTNGTYTFNPSFALSRSLRIVGSIASAFKAPTLYQLYSPYGERTLKPETSTTWELGAEAIKNNLSARVVFFDRHIKNGIDFNYTTYKYYNSVRQDVRGVEVEISIAATPHLNVNANYTYLHARERSQSRLTFKDSAYNYLLRRPAHSFNVSAQVSMLRKVQIIPSLKYVSRRYDIGGYMQKDVPLDAYVLGALYGEYSIAKPLKVFVDMQNIFNKTFFDVYGYNSVPRTINAGITLTL